MPHPGVSEPRRDVGQYEEWDQATADSGPVRSRLRPITGGAAVPRRISGPVADHRTGEPVTDVHARRQERPRGNERPGRRGRAAASWDDPWSNEDGRSQEPWAVAGDWWDEGSGPAAGAVGNNRFDDAPGAGPHAADDWLDEGHGSSPRVEDDWLDEGPGSPRRVEDDWLDEGHGTASRAADDWLQPDVATERPGVVDWHADEANRAPRTDDAGRPVRQVRDWLDAGHGSDDLWTVPQRKRTSVPNRRPSDASTHNAIDYDRASAYESPAGHDRSPSDSQPAHASAPARRPPAPASAPARRAPAPMPAPPPAPARRTRPEPPSFAEIHARASEVRHRHVDASTQGRMTEVFDGHFELRAAPAPRPEPESRIVAEPEAELVNGRRTVTITGRGSDRSWSPADPAASRPKRRAIDRVGYNPDRAAMWAVLLGIILLLVAAASSHAAVVSHHVVHLLQHAR